jgi:hypothetical protein
MQERAAMARYFFHIVQNDMTICDPEGAEFPRLEWAKDEAIATARDIARQDISDGVSLKGCRVEIRDTSGALVASVGLHDVLDNPERPAFRERS